MPLTLFTAPGIPNPDVVHAYLAETGIGADKVATAVVDVMKGEPQPAARALPPWLLANYEIRNCTQMRPSACMALFAPTLLLGMWGVLRLLCIACTPCAVCACLHNVSWCVRASVVVVVTVVNTVFDAHTCARCAGFKLP